MSQCLSKARYWRKKRTKSCSGYQRRVIQTLRTHTSIAERIAQILAAANSQLLKPRSSAEGFVLISTERTSRGLCRVEEAVGWQ